LDAFLSSNLQGHFAHTLSRTAGFRDAFQTSSILASLRNISHMATVNFSDEEHAAMPAVVWTIAGDRYRLSPRSPL
jgi:hypothetical protein